MAIENLNLILWIVGLAFFCLMEFVIIVFLFVLILRKRKSESSTT